MTQRLSRRRLIAVGATSALSVGAVLGTSQVEGGGRDAQAQPTAATANPSQTNGQPAAGFEYFTPFQAAIVSAACARIIPTDDNGPGATEAGVVYFIDRQLSSDHGLTGRRYEHSPYAMGTSTQGDQSGLLMRDRYRLGVLDIEAYARQLFQQVFAQLNAGQQDRVLSDMEKGTPQTFDGSSIQSATTAAAASGTEGGIRQPTPGGPGVGASAFFNLLRSHAIARFFVDPVHGGNCEMVGWKLIGFPGAQMSYAGSIAQYGQPWQGGYKSLAEYLARSFPGERSADVIARLGAWRRAHAGADGSLPDWDEVLDRFRARLATAKKRAHLIDLPRPRLSWHPRPRRPAQ
jgi:gluconate 2-dehydrogenase gamma chain